MKFTVHTNLTEKVAEILADRSNKAEMAVAVQVQKDTSPYVPWLTGTLDRTTRVVGNTIIYPGPYARYLYYGKVMVYPPGTTGKYKNPLNPRHKGEKKIPTNIPLRYTGSDPAYRGGGHRLAGSHWFERSKAENLDDWLKLAEKWVNTGHE